MVGSAHSQLVTGQAYHLSSKCVFQLRHLCRIGRSLFFTRRRPVATLVHRIVAIRVDYFMSVDWPGLRRKRQTSVLNAAAHVVSKSNRGKYDRELTHFRRHVLHWLNVTGRKRSGCAFRVQMSGRLLGTLSPTIWNTTTYLLTPAQTFLLLVRLAHRARSILFTAKHCTNIVLLFT